VSQGVAKWVQKRKQVPSVSLGRKERSNGKGTVKEKGLLTSPRWESTS